MSNYSTPDDFTFACVGGASADFLRTSWASAASIARHPPAGSRSDDDGDSLCSDVEPILLLSSAPRGILMLRLPAAQAKVVTAAR